jgi:hypothetical protein
MGEMQFHSGDLTQYSLVMNTNCSIFLEVFHILLIRSFPKCFFTKETQTSDMSESTVRSTGGCKNSRRKGEYQCTVTYGTFVK